MQTRGDGGFRVKVKVFMNFLCLKKFFMGFLKYVPLPYLIFLERSKEGIKLKLLAFYQTVNK